MLFSSPLGEGYPFRHIKKRPSVKDGLLICTHTYRFKTRLNKVYLVDAEEYKHNIFIIKFYLKSHQNSKKKFNLTTKTVDSQGCTRFDSDGWRILTTCLRIMRELRDAHPTMSGGFIGAPLEEEIEEEEKLKKEGRFEGKKPTKRFKVWSQAALTFFDPEHYNHYSNAEASTYFIEYKASKTPNLLDEAARMFNELYLDMEDLLPSSNTSQVG